MRDTFRTILYAGALSAVLASSAAAAGFSDGEIDGFIQQMVDKHQFDADALHRLFADAKLRQDIIEAISRPAEAKPWYDYRPIFVTRSRVQGGVRFWQEHAAELQKAEQVYGVPAPIIVAILGVETRYGKHAGRYRVLDSLSTLAFAYPPRSRFFRSELEQYLLMTREEQVDPASLLGSYAGAMGQPQFISSSFRAYAVDFDGDGKRDLWNDAGDAIGSVANYFKRHGWRAGEPVAQPARITGAVPQKLLDAGIKPQFSLAELTRHGVQLKGDPPKGVDGALFALETRDGPEYWVGWNNFYVITRYNHSPLYAMAVYQLSEAIRQARTF